MKEKLIIISVAILLNACYSSSQVKGYAFTQPVIRGASPNGAIDESGKEIASIPKKNSANYFFYFEYSPEKNTLPVAIWLKDKGFKVKVAPTTNNPVVMTDPMFPGKKEKTILVPATKNKVVAVSLDYDMPLNQKTSGKLEKLLENAEVVFEYVYKGKTYYKAVEKITQLTPVALQ